VTGEPKPKASSETKPPRPFDVATVEHLIELMGRHELTVVDLREGNQRILLQRGPKTIAAPLPLPAAAPMAASLPVATPTTPAPAAPAAAPPKETKKLLEIKSPTPGTFYASPNPDSPPFVQAGSKVTPTTIVCIIEAMKVFNEIPAECAGTVVSVHVQNQQAVEYGQVLFKVDPG
jgi:acetyl-CoA carboxylase biotin carboxyl carrier protein